MKSGHFLADWRDDRVWVRVAAMLLSPDRSLLLVVHVQARLAAAMDGKDAVVERSAKLVKAARRLDIPLIVLELNPASLGGTVRPIADLAVADEVMAGTHYSCAREPALIERLQAAGRTQIVLCGMEAHVCVLQTALGLVEKGYRVTVVADAAGSRQPSDHAAAMTRLVQNGVTVATSEMVMFEWLQHAGNAAFTDVLALIK
ncbi:MAG TPA: hydrolase [Alphaproteobacteria bacterium]|nr:hydrolase [Alphaproteobacteria bacterium]